MNEKGNFIVEPGIGISDFIEKINKLSYKNFPVDEVINVLNDNPLSLDLLDPYIFFSDARYTRNLIYKAADFELLLLCWNPGQHSAIHGHESQKCWMRIEEGELELTDYQPEPDGVGKLLKKINTRQGKRGFVDGPATIHAIKNETDKQAISLHIYAHPLEECDIYDLEKNEKKRLGLGYHSIHGKLIAPEDKR